MPPLVIVVHMASVWVPFTSEAKEAIAGYDEIAKEIRLALQECGRRVGVHVFSGRFASRPIRYAKARIAIPESPNVPRPRGSTSLGNVVGWSGGWIAFARS